MHLLLFSILFRLFFFSLQILKYVLNVHFHHMGFVQVLLSLVRNCIFTECLNTRFNIFNFSFSGVLCLAKPLISPWHLFFLLTSKNEETLKQQCSDLKLWFYFRGSIGVVPQGGNSQKFLRKFCDLCNFKMLLWSSCS